MDDVALISLEKLELWSSRPIQNSNYQAEFCMSETVKNQLVVS